MKCLVIQYSSYKTGIAWVIKYLPVARIETRTPLTPTVSVKSVYHSIFFTSGETMPVLTQAHHQAQGPDHQ